MSLTANGRVFKSIDERCAACVVMGGDENPCVPDSWLEADEAKGFPCPRREWPDADGPMLGQLVRLGASGESGHLFGRLWDVAFGELERTEQRRLLTRVLRAYGDPDVRAALWPRAEE